MRDALLGDRLAATGWFERPAIGRLIDEHQTGARDHSAPLWTLLMFEAFLRKVVDGGAAAPAAAPAGALPVAA